MQVELMDIGWEAMLPPSSQTALQPPRCVWSRLNLFPFSSFPYWSSVKTRNGGAYREFSQAG